MLYFLPLTSYFLLRPCGEPRTVDDRPYRRDSLPPGGKVASGVPRKPDDG